MTSFKLIYRYVSSTNTRKGGRMMSIRLNRIRKADANTAKLNINGRMASGNPALLGSAV
jgi:hypothetical protein